MQKINHANFTYLVSVSPRINIKSVVNSQNKEQPESYQIVDKIQDRMIQKI